MRTTLSLLFAATAALAQFPGLTLTRVSPKASVTQFIGPVKVTIDYSSPSVTDPSGKDRRGQIWGKLVPYGMTDLGFGTAKLGPWRAGADENTVFSVSDPVLIEGKPLAAGRYGLHMIANPDEWTIVFSNNSTSWGSFYYRENEDALRVNVKPRKHEFREWLSYEFPVRKADHTVVELRWEELAVPFTVKVGNIKEVYLTHLRQELRTQPGFSYQGFVAAAQWCLQENTNLEEALTWADAAISMPYVGQANFRTLSNKAQVLAKLGRETEGSAIMDSAVRSYATDPTQIHRYGRDLLAAKKTAEAMKVFRINAERFGDQWPVHVGLARGYAAKGETAKALEHARKALPQAPDALNRKSMEEMVRLLESGKPAVN